MGFQIVFKGTAQQLKNIGESLSSEIEFRSLIKEEIELKQSAALFKQNVAPHGQIYPPFR